MNKTTVIRTEGKFIEDLPPWGWTSSKSKFVPSDDVTAIRFYLPEHFSTFFLIKKEDECIFDGVIRKIDFETLKDKSFKEIEKIFFPHLDFDEEEEIEEFVQKNNLTTFQS